jgi:hypothetical protein
MSIPRFQATSIKKQCTKELEKTILTEKREVDMPLQKVYEKGDFPICNKI